ncbi:hypothetical protein A2U01_0060630, partial [Trifolium medium]|nr:hypothetical protein [Trifolium medium]
TFSNVRDVNKLLKALNEVCFEHFRVQAKVARFDRQDSTELQRSRMEKGGDKTVREEVLPKKNGLRREVRDAATENIETQEKKDSGDGGTRESSGGLASFEGVKVGEVMISLKGEKRNEANVA